VFNADNATFTPSQATRRYGFDLDIRAQPLSWLALDFDLSQATATTVSGAPLALAPRLYITGGATASWRGLRGGLRFRYLGARPAFDFDWIQTQPYFIADIYGAYRIRWFEIGFAVQNLANSTWRDAQFGNRSCTKDETNNPANTNYALCGATLPTAQRTGVPDVHFTPGVPFNLQLSARAYF
jgi:hypothetical protein